MLPNPQYHWTTHRSNVQGIQNKVIDIRLLILPQLGSTVLAEGIDKRQWRGIGTLSCTGDYDTTFCGVPGVPGVPCELSRR